MENIKIHKKKKKIKFSFINSLSFNRWSNFIMHLVFVLITIILLKVIVEQIIPSKQPLPPDLSFMLIQYSGLPFAFWLFIGIGIALGLTFHGIKLFNINIEKKEVSKNVRKV